MLKPEISIIIPVLNEQLVLEDLLKHLNTTGDNPDALEIIVVDGGSIDNTITIAKKQNANIVKSKKGRAVQMNTGAKNAQGRVLYFLHADTFPPKGFDRIILEAVQDGYETGCFRMQFDTKNPILRFFAWFTRINHALCRGGDQSLFVTKETFRKNMGFNESYLIYEDSEFIGRLYKTANFKVLTEEVITSARKYRQKGWLKVQFHFAMIHLKNYLGHSPENLYRYYSKRIL